jgi:phage gpG-like protein
MGIKIGLRFPDLADRFKKIRSEAMLVFAAAMQTNRAMMFDKDGADNGKPKWAALKWRSGRPLQKTGVLRKSFAPQNDGIRPGRGQDSILKVMGDTVTIGTKLLVARMMNDGTTKMPGGVLRPRVAQALRFPKPHGAQGFMFRKSVKIPSRPMDIVTDEDKREWAETLRNFLTDALNE